MQVANAYFLVIAGSSNAVGWLLSGLVVDRVSVRSKVLANIFGNALLVAVYSASPYVPRGRQDAVAAFALAYGAAIGFRDAFGAVVIASCFGTAALGRLNGVQAAASTAATGVGPLLFAVSHRLTGTYAAAVASIAVIHAAFVAIAALAALRFFRSPPNAATLELEPPSAGGGARAGMGTSPFQSLTAADGNDA